MKWMMFVTGTVLFWGMYGVALHRGQVLLGNPMRALFCVGVAYFFIAILTPLITLSYEGGFGGFNWGGSIAATLGGAFGALGAACIIWAFKSGGLPTYVMPLVFAGAPLVNVVVSMAYHPPKAAPSPMLYLGFVLAAAGAGMVLYFRPAS